MSDTDTPTSCGNKITELQPIWQKCFGSHFTAACTDYLKKKPSFLFSNVLKGIELNMGSDKLWSKSHTNKLIQGVPKNTESYS